MKSFAILILAVVPVAAPGADYPPNKKFANSLGMPLIRIEPGHFTMGSHDLPPTTRAEWEERDWDESPAHKVRITSPFYAAATEVTNAQYEVFDPAHKKLRGVRLAGNLVTSADDEPVVAVSWHEANAFCKWLSKKEGRIYRLPSEAEWEYACRAGSADRFCFGNDERRLADYAWFARNSKKQASAVAGRKPNAWGLYDMHGNVQEWCLDWHGPYEIGRAHV